MAGHRLGALEGGGGCLLMHPCPNPTPTPTLRLVLESEKGEEEEGGKLKFLSRKMISGPFLVPKLLDLTPPPHRPLRTPGLTLRVLGSRSGLKCPPCPDPLYMPRMPVHVCPNP